MSVLVVGMSHRSAPVSVLERVAFDPDGAAKFARQIADLDHVTEATVLSTCNRCEIYAEVDRFHGSIEAISALLCDRAGMPADELISNLYVHYDDAAVSHLFSVASGLDSMVVGESQIIGQAREALRLGQETGTVGAALNVLFQQALRVGKRVHAETDIDKAAPSVVSAALERAVDHVGALQGRKVVLVGAGAMAGLAAATLRREGVGELVIANRTHQNAVRLAAQYAGRAVEFTEIAAELADADLLISCTGSTGLVITAEHVSRRAPGARLAIADLALPHDVDRDIAATNGVRLIDIASLVEELRGAGAAGDVDQVRRIVGDELQAFLAARHAASVTPTVVALRTMATGVVDAELERLDARLPELGEQERAEVAQALRRVADKLLHQPTVRVKELANADAAVSYAAALAELFSLDPEAVEAVTRVEPK